MESPPASVQIPISTLPNLCDYNKYSAYGFNSNASSAIIPNPIPPSSASQPQSNFQPDGGNTYTAWNISNQSSQGFPNPTNQPFINWPLINCIITETPNGFAPTLSDQPILRINPTWLLTPLSEMPKNLTEPTPAQPIVHPVPLHVATHATTTGYHTSIRSGTQTGLTPNPMLPTDAPAQYHKRKRANSTPIEDDGISFYDILNSEEQTPAERKRKLNALSARRRARRKLEHVQGLEKKKGIVEKDIARLQADAGRMMSLLIAYGETIPEMRLDWIGSDGKRCGEGLVLQAS